jgi:hypothetical protein
VYDEVSQKKSSHINFYVDLVHFSIGIFKNIHCVDNKEIIIP